MIDDVLIERAAIVRWLRRSAAKDQFDLERLQRLKKLTPNMIAEWISLIQAKEGIANAIQQAQHRSCVPD